MSEVKRYTPSMRVGHMVQDKDGLWNRSQDFDRVTAERDAALGRADALEGLLRRVVESSVLSFEQDAPEELESLEADICAALKPAGGSGDE